MSGDDQDHPFNGGLGVLSSTKRTARRAAVVNATRDGNRPGGGIPAFTVSEAAEVRRRLAAFANPRTLATEYGVSPNTILAAGKRDYVGRPDPP